MPRSSQALWGQREIFLLLDRFMDPNQAETETLKLLHSLSGWMVFSRDDTLLGIFYEACAKRLESLSPDAKKAASKELLVVAKNYKYSKEYKALVYLCQSLYEDSI